MMIQLLEIIMTTGVNILTACNMMLIMRLFFGMETCKKKWQFGLFAGTFAMIHILMYTFLLGQNRLVTILFLLHMVMIAVVLSPKRRFQALLCTIPAFWIYSQFGVVCIMVEELIPLPAIVEGQKYTVFSIVSDIILILLLVTGVRYFEKKNLLQPIKVWETLFLTAFCFIAPIFIDILELLMDVQKSTFRNVAWVLFVVGVNVAIVYGIFHRRKSRYYKSLSGNYKEQFDNELQYFKEYKENQQETMRFRHDWKNHILVMQSMLEREEYEKARNYFAELSMGMQSVSGQFVTGNEILDIILNAKKDVLEENRICVECDGNLAGLQLMEDADCCVLFSNLIDNAVEANLRCEGERFIQIKADERIGYLRIVMENAFAGEVIVESEGIRTTKEEPGHGIGTRNAFAIIRKYQGDYEVRTEKQRFSFAMIFPKEKQ